MLSLGAPETASTGMCGLGWLEVGSGDSRTFELRRPKHSQVRLGTEQMFEGRTPKALGGGAGPW